MTKNLTDPSIISQSPLLSHDQLKIYQAIIGSLNYLSNRTRLDISLITGVLARHVCEPHLIHLKAAYKVIEYLLATKDYGLLFCKSENDQDTLHVDIYSDASHNDTDDHKPTLGMLMLIDNCPITWMSKKAKVISQSTMESEFYSLCEATMEAQFITNYLHELLSIKVTPTIYCDNRAALQYSKSSRFHNRAKHIDLKYAFIREHLRLDHVKLIWCSTEDQLADLFTKPITGARFNKLVDRIMSPST
jgi:hypothetical protein